MNDLLVHNEQDSTLAFILANMIHNPGAAPPDGRFPRRGDAPTYEEMMQQQIAKAKSKRGEGDLQKLLDGDETWEIQ